jgi:hypothetical protein
MESFLDFVVQERYERDFSRDWQEISLIKSVAFEFDHDVRNFHKKSWIKAFIDVPQFSIRCFSL